MKNKPEVTRFIDGSAIWKEKFNTFSATVYIPSTTLPEDIINFGYEAPYLLYFDEEEKSFEEVKAFADKSGLSKVASSRATSVVFINTLADGGWNNSDEELFKEIIENSKIHQYHEDGMAVLVNRFSKSTDGYAIRGAIFRTYLYGHGEAADYIATKLMKRVDGAGLWGPADVCPTAVILDGLTKAPVFERKDIPVISVNNKKEFNDVITSSCENSLIADTPDFEKFYKEFLVKYIRWGWDGELSLSPDFEELGMTEEFCVTTVKTSPDNLGDYAGSSEHRLGYIAFYNKDLFEKGPAPMLLCFHGGGDSAMHISEVSQWYRVAKDHDFLLVCIEDHLNSTATEMMELIEQLKEKYRVNSEKIYASGFSMGGCKSWDLYQEYPCVFAGLAPMDATFEVGLNVFGKPAPVEINKDVLVPIFYIGGEITPLPELPFQADKCLDRMKYVFEVNDIVTKHTAEMEDVKNWPDPIWGISGDEIEKVDDLSRGSVLTMNLFRSSDGNIYTSFGCVSGQGHECRYHSCEHAWRFLEKFSRNSDGKIEISK